MPSVVLTKTLAFALLLASLSAPLPAAEPVRVIFDTDMGNDIDDALALAVLHALESRGEARLLAVTLTKDNRWAAPYCDLVNHFYGRGSIPVGVVRNGPTPKDAPMIQTPSERKDAHGVLLYPRRIRSGEEAPEATGLLRSVLEAQPDQSVVIVQVGFSTNLARLLASPGGRDLVTRKVRLLSAMAGNFVLAKPEYNVKIDIPSAQKVFHEWPTPIVASGFEIGEAILYPASSIERDFGWAKNHPVVDAYRAYKQMPYDRPTWDLTSALYAVRPDAGYFGLSAPGSIRVDAEGNTKLEPASSGKHRYLTVTKDQITRVREALVQLASQPARR
jgi:inosine-uridine nucleoside N-ribohydrolase